MRSAYLVAALRSWLVFWLLAVLVFTAGRLALFAAYIDETVRQRYADDVGALFWKGLLFDIKTASILTAVLVLPGLLCLLSRFSMRMYQAALPKLLSLLAALAVAASVANFFYFQVYERQFDVFVFGLLEEGTAAVLATIWADYPVLPAAFGLLVLLWLLHRLFTRLAKGRTPATAYRTRTVVVCTIIAVLALAAGSRASFGKFPLRQDGAQVSASVHLNRLVPNALLALDWARKEYAYSQNFQPVSDEEGRALVAQITGNPQASSLDLQQFDALTPPNPAVQHRPPNVVLAVMESMGSHVLSLHQPDRDLLGRLAEPWQQDWVYRRFVSEGDGTSDTMHRLLVRSHLNLSQSTAKNKPFPGNVFQPYLDAGYRVLFITAGNGGWRDFNTFLRHLGVHEVVDENTLKAQYPEARSTTWGVPDEFMFRYAAEQLAAAEQSGRPVFIMMLSMTNHPPYELPTGGQRMDFRLTEAERQRFAQLAQGEALNEILNTFRYANDQLGGFIAQVKQNAPHTIIAATGDHNMRAIGYPKAEEAALGHAVPFYLYVPPAYRQQAVFRADTPGSHKDVMPTLYELSLSGIHYYRTGCNLTTPQERDYWCGYGYNPEVLLLQDGFYHLGNQKFYAWQQRDGLMAAETEQPSAHPEVIERGKAYTGFLNWQILRAINTSP